MKNRVILCILVFCFTFVFLASIQLKVDKPMLLLERFISGGGWIQISALSIYGAVVAWFTSIQIF